MRVWLGLTRNALTRALVTRPEVHLQSPLLSQLLVKNALLLSLPAVLLPLMLVILRHLGLKASRCRVVTNALLQKSRQLFRTHRLLLLSISLITHSLNPVNLQRQT